MACCASIRSLLSSPSFFTGEIRRFNHVALLSSQFDCLVIEHDGDYAEHQYKRRQGQQYDFFSQLHAHSPSSRRIRSSESKDEECAGMKCHDCLCWHGSFRRVLRAALPVFHAKNDK